MVKTNLDDWWVKDALKMHQIGFSVAKISEHFCIPKHRVWKVLKDNGAEMNGNKIRMVAANEQKEICDLYLSGMSAPKIAKLKARLTATIYGVLKNNNIRIRSHTENQKI
jgi:hypothetical protein